MKILQVAFLLLFNYLDSLPKLFYICVFDSAHFHLFISTSISGVLREKDIILEITLHYVETIDI